MWHFLLRKKTTWINYVEDRMSNFYFRLHEGPVRERNYHNNQTWINYFEDRMPSFHFRLHEVPVRERNYHNNQIEFNIMHNNRWKKGFLFIHQIYQTLLMLFIITGYYSRSLIKSPIFSIMHNSRKICILPNFSLYITN